MFCFQRIGPPELHFVSTDLMQKKPDKTKTKPLRSVKKVQEVPSLLLSDSIEEQPEETQIQKACEKFQELTKDDNCLDVCKDARHLEKPQHTCRRAFCDRPLSQICHCNMADPDSDNPMHRIHKIMKNCTI